MLSYGCTLLGESSIPEWLLLAISTLLIVVALVLPGLGFILERRYTGPYTLLATSSQQKWQQAALLTFCQTIWIPLIGLLAQVVHADLSEIAALFLWPSFLSLCGGIWVVAFPVAILLKRWNFEQQLNRYRKMDEMIKAGTFGKLFSVPLVGGMVGPFLSAEQRRFFKEGYSRSDVGEAREKRDDR